MSIKFNADQAVLERFWWHTVGIANSALVTHGTDGITGLKATEEGAPGTGVAGFWGKHHFILTAKHVLDGARPSHLSFFVRETGELRTKHASDVTIQDASLAVPLNDPDTAIYRCDSEDLALLTMKPDGLGSKIFLTDF
jgi:hypothetical protein